LGRVGAGFLELWGRFGGWGFESFGPEVWAELFVEGEALRADEVLWAVSFTGDAGWKRDYHCG
jgi:hypothetical protein